MIRELRKIELELDLNPTNLDLMERYIALSKRLGRDCDFELKFPVCRTYIKEYFSNDKDLIEKYIEIQNRYKFGDPAWAAYFMVAFSGSDRSWAERIIESSETGNPAGAAYCIVRDFHSDRSWAEHIIENAKNDDMFATQLMVEDCGSSQEWADKVKKLRGRND